MEKFSKVKHYAATVMLVILFFSLGTFWGNNNRPAIEKAEGLTGKETAVDTDADFSPFWKVWNEINEKYPGAAEVADQERVYGAIQGLVDSLDDPYSVYYDPEETKAFKEDIAGNFEGVGMEVGLKDKVLTVIAPLKDTPAYRAGIKAGDRVMKIGEEPTAGLSVEEAVKMIRGEKGTTVTLTIVHEGSREPEEIKIVRDTINIPTLDTELREDKIFVIRLYSFSANSTNLFRKALKEFVDAKTDKLLLDLRSNPGGYLNAAIDMSSWFVEGGKVILTEDYGDNRSPEIYRSRGYDIFNEKLKFVILIDGGSASASEIVAGAMQDLGKAKLVGTQSFGKGSVQEVVNITPETLLKITVARWLTPNGVSISEKGLTPDYEVEVTREDVAAKRDPQMDKAVELLLNWE
ncbi:MAG: Carboxyl-terminal protease [Candidatus Nomurabacteria bacterium GW2011_GWB1_47_6]|uniref:Carboxyl-terminal protease n=1 Tax=Candidatus Nomurabacteria bacterium GW2011_GWB1_47_6 TaxID=1618749 RepID=A0A0G1T0M8_9BACT|nr:MAG: Carboxyl-terminal protease [Candidatus Nomurabacteria bacterium GW2011_GWB1_47_6]